jgi:hypothetical protein
MTQMPRVAGRKQASRIKTAQGSRLKDQGRRAWEMERPTLHALHVGVGAVHRLRRSER